MRWWIVVAMVGCSSRESPPQSAIDRCARGAAAALYALTSVRFTEIRDLQDLACADLYRQPACATAWRDAFTPGDTEVHARAIEAACAAAYCAQLPVAPASCTHAPDGSGLRELDTAILKFEGLDVVTARAIAARVVVFDTVVVKRTEAAAPQPPATESVVVTIDAVGELTAAGKPIDRAELPHLFEGLAAVHGQLVVKARPGTAHGLVVDLMEQAKRAGVTRMAIGTAE